MKYNSLFVTGTDTGIGKTTVSCILAASLRRRGLRVGVFKPAETGCPEGNGAVGRVPQDVLKLKYFSGCELPLESLCPYALREPLAPMVAARIEAVHVDLDRIEASHRRIAAAHDVTLIEGAGGLLVPLAEGASFVDLAKRLNAATLVVVGNRLGAINHALLTIRHAQAAGLNVVGYILNQLHAEIDLAAATNIEVLAELLGPPLGIVPYVPALEPREEVRDQLSQIGTARLLIESLLIPSQP